MDHRNWRANIYIDGKAWEEDDLVELRVGSMLIRSVGPCKRCPATQVNYDTHAKNPEMEPQLTLNTFRKHPQIGDVFGMYFQMEHLPENLFNWATKLNYAVAT